MLHSGGSVSGWRARLSHPAWPLAQASRSRTCSGCAASASWWATSRACARTSPSSATTSSCRRGALRGLAQPRWCAARCCRGWRARVHVVQPRKYACGLRTGGASLHALVCPSWISCVPTHNERRLYPVQPVMHQSVARAAAVCTPDMTLLGCLQALFGRNGSALRPNGR